MKEIYHQLIDNCEKAIKDLEENYMMFDLMSGGLMKNSGSILLSEIENLKKEKEDLWEIILNLVKNIRQEKSNAKKPMNSEIKLTLPKEQVKKLNGVIEDLKSVSNAVEIKEGEFKVEFI